MMLRYTTWIVMVFMLAATSIGIAQQHEVTGTVTDATTGATLPGVNVIIDGTNLGTVTNIDGEYSIPMPSANAVLVFSYIGYERLTVPVDGRSLIDVALSQDVFLADELVVVGYGVQQKVNLTGSVGIVSSRDLENRSVASVEEALQGAIPGLKLVRTSGQPGNQSIDINIRGTSTFTNNPALIIVDGVPSSLDMLNPNDIESISVLKDASTAAIYGSRATGGVILVTTKRGQAGTHQFNYRSTVSLQQPTRLPEKVSAIDYAQMHNLASTNDGISPLYGQSDLDRFSSPEWRDHDWEGYLLNNAPQTNQNISVSGGTDTHTYYLSIGYLNQNGIINNSDFERWNIQANQNFKIGDKFSFDVRGGYAPSNRTEPAYPWSHLRWIDATPKIFPFKSEDGKWLETPAHTSGGNAMANLSEDGGQSILKNAKVNGNITANYNLAENLNIQASYGSVFTNSRSRSFRNILRVFDPLDTERVAVESEDNFLDVNNFRESLQNINVITTYNNNYKDHSFAVLLGASREWFETENDFVGTRNFLTDNIFTISAGSSNPVNWQISGGAADWALESYFSRINYSFRNKYLFEAAIRYDGSSRFTEDLRWGAFPSFSGGWLVSEESFLKNHHLLTFLKVRGSWGQVGNQNVGFYPFANRLSEGAYFFNSSPQRAVGTAGAANPFLTWETKEASNFGLEGSVFENLFEFEVDLFFEKTYDILLQLPLPTTFGTPAPVQNAGRVDNRGWEVQLSHRNTLGDFSYGVSFHISDATNKVNDMGGISPRIFGDTITEEGRPMNEWFGLKADGFFQSQAEVENHAFQDAQTSAGDNRYVDQNGDGVIDSNDRVRLGRSDPRFPFGVRINLSYKNFDFSALGQGVFKHNAIQKAWEASGAADTYRVYHLDYWTEANTNPRFPKPRLGSGPGVGINKEFSSFWLEDAAYFRLKHVEIGYNLSHDLMDRLGIRNARVFASAENLLTFTSFLGYDPELATGLDRRQIQSRYPLAKLYNLGININF